MFKSLLELRAHCGEPTIALEKCPICSAIPAHCSRQRVSSLVSDYDVDFGDEGRGADNVPLQVAQLDTITDGHGSAALMRCPTCHRLYHHTTTHEDIGARIYSTDSYERVDVEAFCCSDAALAFVTTTHRDA